jgi:hypothetical protein
MIRSFVHGVACDTPDMRRLIVVAMVNACGTLDRMRPLLPWPLTRLACPSGLALWSSELDQRWGTRVWRGTEGQGRCP